MIFWRSVCVWNNFQDLKKFLKYYLDLRVKWHEKLIDTIQITAAVCRNSYMFIPLV
jgi:hypothetical protein